MVKRKTKAKPKPKPKPKRKPKPKLTLSLANMTAWYRQLLKSGTYKSECESQAFFYDALWSNDEDLEGAFIDWVDTLGNPQNLPFDIFEEELVQAEKFETLYGFFELLSPALVERALPLIRDFLAHPKKRRGERYDEIEE